MKQSITYFDANAYSVALNVDVEVLQSTDLPEPAKPRSAPAGKVMVFLRARLREFVTPDHFRPPLYFSPTNHGEISVFRQRDLLPVGREIARVLAERVLPCLDEVRNVGALHAALQSADHPLWPLTPSDRLAIAILAGGSDIREAAAQELAALENYRYDHTRRCLDRATAMAEKERVGALLEWLDKMD